MKYVKKALLTLLLVGLTLTAGSFHWNSSSDKGMHEHADYGMQASSGNSIL